MHSYCILFLFLWEECTAYVLAQLMVQLLQVYRRSHETTLGNTYKPCCTSVWGWSNEGHVRSMAPFFYSLHIHFSSSVDFNFIMKELFWKPYVCQENKPSLNITPSSGRTLDVDDGTVRVCFDAASKKVFHTKCLTYPEHYAKASWKPAVTYQTSCSRRTAPPPPLQSRLEKETHSSRLLLLPLEKDGKKFLQVHVHELM